MVNKERIELWAQDLESDGYRQCKGHLKLPTQLGYPMHCAEGVAMAVAEMHGVQIDRHEWGAVSMPPRVYQWYGITGNVIVNHEWQGNVSVIYANDRAGMSFWDIAQGIRAMYLKDEE